MRVCGTSGLEQEACRPHCKINPSHLVCFSHTVPQLSKLAARPSQAMWLHICLVIHTRGTMIKLSEFLCGTLGKKLATTGIRNTFVYANLKQQQNNCEKNFCNSIHWCCVTENHQACNAECKLLPSKPGLFKEGAIVRTLQNKALQALLKEEPVDKSPNLKKAGRSRALMRGTQKTAR